MSIKITDIKRELEDSSPMENAELIAQLAYGLTQEQGRNLVSALKNQTRAALRGLCVHIWPAVSRANVVQFMEELDGLAYLLEPAVPHAIEQIENIIE